MDENAIRERLRGDIRRYEAPPRQLEQVIRRAGRLRFLRVVVAAAVGGLMIVGVAGPLLVLSSIQGPPRRPAGTGSVNPTVTADVAIGDFPSAITTRMAVFGLRFSLAPAARTWWRESTRRPMR
jgi:hypothetical protein